MPPEFLAQMGQSAQGGLTDFFGGLFGNTAGPYKDAMKQFEKYYGQANQMQSPFYQAGVGAIPQYQNYLGGMKNPSQFINNIMGGYQESPWAKFQQDQATRAAQNQGSAMGLTGSTPLTQYAQQNARDISSQDMGSWLQNVLGVNKQYGEGLNNLVSGGQGAANNMSNMLAQLAQLMGQGAYGAGAGQNQDRNNIIGGIIKLLT